MKRKLFLLPHILLGFLLTMGLFSCNNYLDQEPISDVTPDEYLWSADQLAAYAIERYTDILPSHDDTWSFGTFGTDAGTDNMANPSIEDRYTENQYLTGETNSDWDFSNIYECNYFLNTVLPRWEAGELTGDDDLIKQYIGEVYFLRAYEYFSKVQEFGDFPIITTVQTDDQDSLTEASKRAPHSKVVRFIISDLDTAIDLLETDSPDGNKNRINKACAELLKSRVALYEGTWLKYFKGTAFVPNGTDWPGADKDYNSDYQYEAGSIDAEIEWLFQQAMSAAEDVADNYDLTENNQVLQQSEDDSNNDYFDMFSAVDMSGYSEVLLWRQYSKSLGITHNVPVNAQLGNYAVGLTRGMVDGFLMANGLPIYASGSGYAGDDSIAAVRENRDGRLWLFLKQPGQVNCFENVDEGDHVTETEPVPDITNSSWEKKYTTGYTIRKGLNYDGAQCDNGSGYTGCVLFRATEAYLNYMEACYELNGSLDSKAASYWTAIRERAGVNTDYENTIANTDMSEEAKNDWGAYSAGSLVDPTLYNIRRERRCELMAEGVRLMDLKRWRAMDQMQSTPYHIEGFKLWGDIQNSYDSSDLIYGSSSAVVSSPERSEYLRPYEISGSELVYDGYHWKLAHYWEPLPIEEFLLTSEDNTVASSVLYQNPGWPTEANESATY